MWLLSDCLCQRYQCPNWQACAGNMLARSPLWAQHQGTKAPVQGPLQLSCSPVAAAVRMHPLLSRAPGAADCLLCPGQAFLLHCQPVRSFATSNGAPLQHLAVAALRARRHPAGIPTAPSCRAGWPWIAWQLRSWHRGAQPGRGRAQQSGLTPCPAAHANQRGRGLEAKAHLRRRRAIMKGRAWGQGTMPRRTPLATMRTGVSCISAKATATWRYTGSSRASRALMLPSAPPPTALPACRHWWALQALLAMGAQRQLPHSLRRLQACIVGPIQYRMQWVQGSSCPTALSICRRA